MCLIVRAIFRRPPALAWLAAAVAVFLLGGARPTAAQDCGGQFRVVSLTLDPAPADPQAGDPRIAVIAGVDRAGGSATLIATFIFVPELPTSGRPAWVLVAVTAVLPDGTVVEQIVDAPGELGEIVDGPRGEFLLGRTGNGADLPIIQFRATTEETGRFIVRC
jgi:hypothetical protein